MGSVCEALKALCKSLEFACTCRALWREADAQAHSCASEVAQAVGLDAVLAKQAAVCTSTTMSDEGGPWQMVDCAEKATQARRIKVRRAIGAHTTYQFERAIQLAVISQVQCSNVVDRIGHAAGHTQLTLQGVTNRVQGVTGTVDTAWTDQR